MTLGSTLHHKSGNPERDSIGASETRPDLVRDEVRLACQQQEGLGRDGLLTQVLSRENIAGAWTRVKANKSSASVDGLTIEETPKYLKTHWSRIRLELLNRTYRPQAVRRMEIPKPTGGTRELGMPTVLDRLIQQALLQILQPMIGPTFSEFSYGFRPGRSAHDAVLQVQRYAQAGFRVVVELAAQIAGGAGHWWKHSEAGFNRILALKYFGGLGIPLLT